MKIVSQLELTPPLPTVYGPKDYRDFKAQLTEADNLLLKSGVEEQLIVSYFRRTNNDEPSQKDINRARKAFRCCILKILSGLDYRECANRLADSQLWQWFAGYNTFGTRKTPAKSTFERFMKMFPEEDVCKVVTNLLSSVSDSDQVAELLHGNEAIVVEDIFADSTCVKADIHFPVDWLLLRDGVRSFVKSIVCIRNQGLKHHIPAPEEFVREINSWCIEMTHSARKRDGKKTRKRILRAMKRLSKRISRHGQRCRDLLDSQWESTSWTRKQAELVLKRIDNVLEKLPEAIHQAHERIVAGRLVPNERKILSLYDNYAHVLIRGKAGSEVEFGNGLYLAEQVDGLIVDWQLFEDQRPRDRKLVEESIERIEDGFGKIASYTADRGFCRKHNERVLRKGTITNGICPKSPVDLENRLTDESFLSLQKRRAQTEGRTGIFKNVYPGRRLRCRDVKHKQQIVAWSVLTHNLWLLAGKAREATERIREQEYQKAA